MDAVPRGDGLGRVQRVADVDVGEQPVVAVALVLGRVELEGDGLAVEGVLGERGRFCAEARLGLVGWTTSGVSMPMIRTVSMPLGSSTRTVSPSTTSTTVPARAAGVGVGSGVGDVAGATEWATQRPTRSGSARAWGGDRRDTLVPAARNGSSGNDDRANGEQADLLA